MNAHGFAGAFLFGADGRARSPRMRKTKMGVSGSERAFILIEAPSPGSPERSGGNPFLSANTCTAVPSLWLGIFYSGERDRACSRGREGPAGGQWRRKEGTGGLRGGRA
jgi:hypothetical protein